MRKFSKIICLLLSLSMLFLLITGCEENTDPGTDKSGITVTIRLNYDDAPTMDPLVSNKDGKIVKPSDPTRDGYKFAGWFTNFACTKEYDFDTDLSENTNIRVLYAGWKQSTALVTYDLGGGLFPAGTFEGAYVQTAEVGKRLTLPSATPVRNDYSFLNWCTDADCTIDYNVNSTVEGDMTLYAKWRQDMATYSIILYDDVHGQDGKIAIGTKLTRPTDPSRGEDYRFLGWYSDKNFQNLYDFDKVVTGNITIYAKWEIINATLSYNLNQKYYDNNLDDTVYISQKVAIGGKATRPVENPEIEGFTFVDWCVDKYGNTTYDFDTVINNNTTIYAKWRVSEYTVSFNLNGATGSVVSQTVKHGNYATEPTEPTRTNYEFAGWFDNAGGTGTAYLFDATPVKANITLYAKWTSSGTSGSYTYNFYTEKDGAPSSTVSVKANKKAKEPEKPVKAGYYFAGWYDGNTEYNFNTLATEDKNLYARWLKMNCFEAEYTYIPDDKRGQGSSDNVFGTQIIQYTEDVSINGARMGMSNGAYVGKLYYNGAFVDFEVNAAEECDAVILLRLTPDLHNFTVTDEEYQVLVNGTKLKYGSLVFDDAYTQEMQDAGIIGSPDLEKRPFRNYAMPMCHLNKGHNTIRILTNNSHDYGGTYNADTPLLDCIYVCAEETLAWQEGCCHPENYKAAGGRTMADVNLNYIIADV